MYDVGIIGGGIIGASAANQLAAAGFSTLLLERADFAGATTGRTSRLQYAGLSYLAGSRSVGLLLRHPMDALQGVNLARRAMKGRSEFIRRVPERVRPVTFLMPIHREDPISVRQIMLGMKALELLDPGGVPLDAHAIEASEAQRHPVLRLVRDQNRLAGAIGFVEYQYHWPERICVDIILNAEESGADVRNYTSVGRIERQIDGTWRIDSHDHRLGLDRSHRVRTIVNCAGAWVDEIASRSALPVPRLNWGLKGTNVAARLPDEFRDIGIETLTRSGEPFYVMPWGELHYFGPINRLHEPTEDGYRVKEDEMSAILEEFNHLFPTVGLTRRDVLYGWAGVRPRTFRAGASSATSSTVVHDLADRGAPGYFAYTGGLLMTHRKAGREIVSAVTRKTAPSLPAKPLRDGARLFRPKGSDAGAAAAMLEPPLGYACANEKVWRLEDLLRRRVSSGWNETLGCDVAHHVALEVRGEMGWSVAQAEAEVRDYTMMTRAAFWLAHTGRAAS